MSMPEDVPVHLSADAWARLREHLTAPSSQARSTRPSTAAAELAASAPSLAPGTAVSGWRIEACVGRSRTGFSYTARRAGNTTEASELLREYMPRSLVVREDSVVRPRASTADAFAAGLAAFVNDGHRMALPLHAAFPVVHGVIEDLGTAFHVSTFHPGQYLSEVLGSGSKEHRHELVVRLLRTANDALTGLHRTHGVHGQLDPNTLRLKTDGHIVLSGFDECRWALAAYDPGAGGLDDPWLAPEQCEPGSGRAGVIGPWTDVYALSAMVYQAVAGEAPPPATLRKQHDKLLPLTRFAGRPWSHQFLHGIDQGLSLRWRLRPQSMLQFMGALGLVERRSRRRPPAPPAATRTR